MRGIGLGKLCLLLAVTLNGGLGIAKERGAKEPRDAPSVIVYVKQGNSSIGALGRAEQTAAEIFVSIGVHIAFRSGEAKGHGGAAVSIEMRLDDGEVPPDFHPGAMAYAAPFANSGTQIHILCERVLNPPRDAGAGVFLGHVMAHEIAHILEGNDHHAAEGLMKAQWGRADIRRMLSGPLPFDPTDAEVIHVALERRGVRAANEPPPQ